MKLSDKTRAVIATVAPALGSALGGPLGTLAGALLSKAVGGDATSVEAAILSQTPESLQAIKKAEQDFQLQLKALEIDEERVAASDRADARQLARVDMGPQKTISFVVMGLYLLVVSGLLVIASQKVELDPGVMGTITFMLGALFREIPTIMQFWFGSSAGSKEKSDDLSSALKKLSE